MSDATRARGRAGVIGVGAMGMAMARNLHAKPRRVLARDVRPAADAEARAAGLSVCDPPRALAAQTDVAIIVVVDAAQIDAVLFDADGVAAAAADGGAKTVLRCSTIAPQATQRFAARLARHGIATIDAPISGGPARALAGTMSTVSKVLAAPAATLAQSQSQSQSQPPLADLADLAEKRFGVSEAIGDAAKATAKLDNNLLAGTNLVAGAEALALAEKIGLDPRAMFETLRASSGASWVFEDRMARALAEDPSPPRAAAHLLTNDVGLATAMAASAAHPTPLGDAALARPRETIERGWAERDDAAVIKTYRA